MSNPAMRNSQRHDKMSWRNRITGTPVMGSERMSVPHSMRDAPKHGMIKVGDWTSPSVIDNLIQVC